MPDGTTVSAGTKRCTKCGETKPLDGFYEHKSCKGGYRPVCKECHGTQVKERRKERAQDSAEAEVMREANAVRSKRWRDNNPDKVAEVNRRYRESNEDVLREYDRNRYAADPDGRKAHIYTWRTRNMDVVRGYATLREARIREAATGPVDCEAVVSRFPDCYLCGLPLTDDVHIDHVVPLSRGGAHSMENLRPTHPACNLRKNSSLLSELGWYTGPTDIGSTFTS